MEIVELLRAGEISLLFIALSAFTIGALHGLEPGHSKTMIAAFIVATRGTVTQAVLLGLSAAVSHSAIVWLLSLAALYYGNELIGEELEPYLIGLSGLVILGVGLWMGFKAVVKTQKCQQNGTRYGDVHGDDHHHPRDNTDVEHDYRHIEVSEHTHSKTRFLDAHAKSHAQEIEKRFDGSRISSGQVILFGLSGGLIPCPAAIIVLLLCMNTGQLFLGISLLVAFSLGLAITMVIVGVIAALGMRYATARSQSLSCFLDYAPMFSALLIGAIGCYMLTSAWLHLL